jgi:hypothetical protein
MNPTHQYRLTLPPREELAHLVRIVAGLAASGQFTYPSEDFGSEGPEDVLAVLRAYSIETAGYDGTTKTTGGMLVTHVAHEILSQLRRDVAQRVDEFPDRYDLTSQPQTE